MIYNSDGVPLREVLLNVALAKNEAATARQTAAGLETARNRSYRVLKDKLGDAYRVFQSIWKETGRYDGAELRGIRKTRMK